MPIEYVAQRASAMTPSLDNEQIRKLLIAIQADVEQLRAQLATHIHSGVTAGGANTGAPTTTIAAASLNLQP